jgi:hypothetical protein
MSKTRPQLSLEFSIPFPPIAFAPPKPAHFTVLPRRHRDPTGEPRKVSIQHLPSPRSTILFKIVAMETYSGNTPRLNRRRQFFSRFRSP